MISTTLLTKEELEGNTKLDAFKRRGLKASATDVAVALDIFVSSDTYTNEGESLENRTCCYWTQTPYSDFEVRAVAYSGPMYWNNPNDWRVGVRPAFTFSNSEEISSNGARNADGYLIADKLEYITKIVDRALAGKLDAAERMGQLERTGKKYTLPNPRNDTFQITEEVMYEGKKYASLSSVADNKTLSNGEEIQGGEKLWAEVTALEGEISGNKFICRQALFPMKFDENTIDYAQSSLKEYLENTFAKEVIASNTLTYTELELKENMNINPYNFDMEEVEELEVIKGYLESDVPIFLHGLPGVGKSSLVKQLDPDCEIVTISTKTPELLIGTGIKNNDTHSVDYIPPPWYTSLCNKCEDDPSRIHILFLDELTNTRNNDSIQKYAYSIALDRMVNDRFPLPKNVRVIGAGNEEKDSKIASSLAAPLHGRFAHVYIETKVDKWLLWATENNIHPSICAYIACRGEDALRTKFTGKEPNADPRKWEMASKVLYKTGKPKLLNGLVGKKITDEFCAFCSVPILTVEDIVGGEYDEEMVSTMSPDRQAAQIAVLSTVSEEHIGEIKEVVSKMNKESRALFDLLWIGNDINRARMIQEMNVTSQENMGGKSR